MEAQEISSRLDYLLKKSSGGIILDEYVKSQYLTSAQSTYVDQALSAYEYSDMLRFIIEPLLKPVTVTTFLGIIPSTAVPVDMKSIVYEVVNDTIKTIPLDFNDIHDARVNPFRKAYKDLAYRVTRSNLLLIYSSETVKKYHYIYCKIPTPIVLEDLPAPLELDGVAVQTTSELPYDSILKVIELAANMIISVESRLANNTQKAVDNQQPQQQQQN